MTGADLPVCEDNVHEERKVELKVEQKKKRKRGNHTRVSKSAITANRIAAQEAQHDADKEAGKCALLSWGELPPAFFCGESVLNDDNSNMHICVFFLEPGGMEKTLPLKISKKNKNGNGKKNTKN